MNINIWKNDFNIKKYVDLYITNNDIKYDLKDIKKMDFVQFQWG